MTERTEPSGASASPSNSSESGTRRFYRSRSSRVLAGVCGGIAEYYGSDATAVRLLTLVLGLFTGIFPMIVLYLVAAIVIPDHEGAPGDPALAPVTSGQLALFFGAFLVVVGIAGFATVWIHVEWEAMWPLVLIGLGAALVVTATRPRR
jgi:phage shock protein PspC (stress-responsive transcriptional regulator)